MKLEFELEFELEYKFEFDSNQFSQKIIKISVCNHSWSQFQVKDYFQFQDFKFQIPNTISNSECNLKLEIDKKFDFFKFRDFKFQNDANPEIQQQKILDWF